MTYLIALLFQADLFVIKEKQLVLEYDEYYAEVSTHSLRIQT